ncbi:MAG: hypothetical protein ACOCQD_02565 [archaeon]
MLEGLLAYHIVGMVLMLILVVIETISFYKDTREFHKSSSECLKDMFKPTNFKYGTFILIILLGWLGFVIIIIFDKH